MQVVIVSVFSIVVCLALSACGGGSNTSPTSNQAVSVPVAPSDPAPAPSDPTPPVVTPTDPLIPEGGILIISGDASTNFTLNAGNNDGPVGSARSVTVTHPDFTSAIEVSVDKPTGEFFNGSITLPITQSLSQGDVVLLHVSFKMISSADETGTGFVTAYVESPAPQYTKYLFYQLSSSGEWQDYYLPMTISDAFDANEIFLTFGFGSGSKSQVV